VLENIICVPGKYHNCSRYSYIYITLYINNNLLDINYSIAIQTRFCYTF